MATNFNINLKVRISQEIEDKIKRIIENNGNYESSSHFVRCAILYFINHNREWLEKEKKELLAEE